MKKFAGFVAIVGFLACVPTPALADPLTLSGTVTMEGYSLYFANVTAHLISSEFDVTRTLITENWAGGNSCPCHVGTVVALGGNMGHGGGSGTILGITYPSGSEPFGLTGTIGFTGSSVVPPATYGETFTITGRFSASGYLFATHNPGPNELYFYTAQVAGTGLATATLSPC